MMTQTKLTATPPIFFGHRPKQDPLISMGATVMPDCQVPQPFAQVVKIVFDFDPHAIADARYSTDFNPGIITDDPAYLPDSIIRVDTIRLDATSTLRAEPIRRLAVVDDDGLFCVESEDIGVSVATLKRDELEESVHRTIAFLWRNYALEDDDNLDSEAANLKARLLSAFVQRP